MTAFAYYNEIEPYAAAWLRNLIAAGHIAPGEVDERSIADVAPDDLLGFRQCHFFAGIGVWSYALRRAGWADDREVWTGSCPCQPFSPAGRGEGFADERHLWPAWHHLISQCRPPVVFGEQVDGKSAAAWLDLVHSDVEAADYAFGATVFPAASVGAPHRRHRTYFVAHATGGDGARLLDQPSDGPRTGREGVSHRGRRNAGGVVQPLGARLEGYGRDGDDRDQPGRIGAQPGGSASEAGGGTGSMADAEDGDRRSRECGSQAGVGANEIGRWGSPSRGIGDNSRDRPGPTNCFWRDPDWLFCRDGKWRPVEPGTSPLVDGSAFGVDSGSPFAGKIRKSLLKAAGNAIVAPQAEEFIAAYMKCKP